MQAVIMGLGVAMQAIGSIQQGNAQAASLNAQAAAEHRNAVIAEQNSSIASQQANVAEEKHRRQARQVLGAQRAALAQNGVGDGGTSQLVLEQSAQNAEMDALNIRYEGELKRRGLLNDSAGMEYNAGILKMNASSAKKAGKIGAATAILSGTSKMMSMSNPAAGYGA